MFPYALLAVRASIADQLIGARLDDPVVPEVEHHVAPRTRTWVAGALRSAADHIAPARPVRAAH
jgi:hypothetical protein